jgi:hypothetical protein
MLYGSLFMLAELRLGERHQAMLAVLILDRQAGESEGPLARRGLLLRELAARGVQACASPPLSGGRRR